MTRQSELVAKLEEFQEGLISQMVSDGDGMVKLHQAEREFQRAQEALRRYVTTGSEQFDRAMGLLRQVADRTQATLTSEQRRRIEGKKLDNEDDTELQGLRKKALGNDKDEGLDERSLMRKRVGVGVAEINYLGEVLIALNKKKIPNDEESVQDAFTTWQLVQKTDKNPEVDKGYMAELAKWRKVEEELKTAVETTAIAEREHAAKVKEAEASGGPPPSPKELEELEKTRQKETAARQAYQKSPLGILHAWEGAVPDAIWQLLDQFEEAKKILKDLESMEPLTLETKWNEAEENYVEALSELDTASTIRLGFEDEIARQTARVKAIEQSGVRRRFSAMRGD